tara:strand:+ start:74915 stop:76279 length:1365 start_codon:yes stop_codon:yes gene_type:complete
MPKYDYDLITIGAGSGGVRASRFAATNYSAKVAVVENRRVGGTCVMRGCVPKKLLMYGAHFAEEFENAAGYGWNCTRPAFDWSSLIHAKNSELDRLESVYHRLLREASVDEICGTGQIADSHTVEVDGKTYTAKRILIATGGYPVMPEIPGIGQVITSDEALDLEMLPERIVIVGGGYIAVEFAGIFNAAGVEVHLVVRGDNILRGFDDAIRNSLRDEMSKKGVSIHSETQVTSIEKCDGAYTLNLNPSGTMDVDVVMYATGRQPNTASLGLDALGVETNERGAIVVDGTSKTTVDSIYAIGDVTDRVNLTPIALQEGMAVAETLFGNQSVGVDYTNIASAVFSQPPAGTVGLSESEARVNHDVDIYMSQFRPMKYSLSGRNEFAMMKLVVDNKTDRVLGCHMVGTDAPEIIQGFAVALKCGATKAQFDATIGIHPTAAEEFVTMHKKLPSHET